MVSVRELSVSLDVAFGTSGVRGLVTNLTPDLCYAYAAAFIQSTCLHSNNSTQDKQKNIAIAMDLRPSSPAIVKACTAAIQDAGYKVIFCGAIPTPALAFYAMSHNMPCIMVTGSHIPFDRNGIKFYRAEGEITKEDESAITSQKVKLPMGLAEKVAQTPLPELNNAASSIFLSRYTSLFSGDASCNTTNSLMGMKVGFYQHSSVARDLLTAVLQKLGADVVELERTETFVPIDTEAVSPEDVEKGKKWSQQGFDALISTDGDGDRPLIGDEKGTWLRGDIVGILCAEYLQASHAVTPVNSNTALELSSVEHSLRTRIGSPYVIAGMESLLQEKAIQKKHVQQKEKTPFTVVGYEANGGFLVGTDTLFQNKTLTALPTRDSFLPIVLLLAHSNSQKKPLSQLANHLVPRFTASDRIKNIPTATSKSLLLALLDSKEQQKQLLSSISSTSDVVNGVIENHVLDIVEFNQLDGLRMILSNGEIVHLRPSGNAPELRCYAEADSNGRAEVIVSKVLELITKQVN